MSVVYATVGQTCSSYLKDSSQDRFRFSPRQKKANRQNYSLPTSRLSHTSGPPSPPKNDKPDKKINAWFESVGLAFNPFEPLEAGTDARLSTYLVGHDAFETLRGDWPAVLFAPAGGGKSAFRVRLAYACRTGEKGRRVFPILYHLPRGLLPLTDHLQKICWAAAHELLLELAWRPGWFEGLNHETRQQIRLMLDWNAPDLLDHFLPQLRAKGSPMPIVNAYDPSAAHLSNPPAPERVRALCNSLQALAGGRTTPPPPEERFEQLLNLILSKLRFRAIYILVDGIDAYPETLHSPATALSWLEPMMDRLPTWSKQAVFLKLFLPEELEDIFVHKHKLLTSQVKSTKIEWTVARLVDMLKARIQAASRGEFDSLDAVSSPGLHHIEQELASIVPPNPRELLLLANRLVQEHVRRAPPDSPLKSEDLEAAIAFYKDQNTAP